MVLETNWTLSVSAASTIRNGLKYVWRLFDSFLATRLSRLIKQAHMLFAKFVYVCTEGLDIQEVAMWVYGLDWAGPG